MSEERAGTGHPDAERLRGWLLVALVVTVPTYAQGALWRGPQSFDFSETVFVFGFDVAQAGLLWLWVREGGAAALLRRLPATWAGRLATALVVVAVASAVAHPYWRSIDLLLRATAVVAIVDELRRATPEWRRRVLGALVVAGSAEAVLAIAQSAHHDVIGLGPLEFPELGFRYAGDAVAAQAGFFHPYALAAFLLVAIGAAFLLGRSASNPAPLWAAAALIGFSLARTYSRTSVVALALACLVALGAAAAKRLGWRPVAVVALAAVGLAAGAATARDGWSNRVAQTSSAATTDTGRRERAAEAIRLVRSSPVVGVGLGRYTTALRDVDHGQLVHSHDVVLQAAAELGVPGGLLTAALLALGAWWAIRAGPAAWVLLCLLAPFWVIDALPVVYPIGIVIAALWVGLIAGAGAEAEEQTERQPG